jgi:integrase
MGRPPLELGTAGKVRVYPSGDRFRARTLYRDHDGRTRAVERFGNTRGAARQALAAAIRDRARHGDTATITPESRLEVVAEHWFVRVTEAGRSPSTLQVYRDRLDSQVIPALGNVRLRELSVGLVDRHLDSVRINHGNAVAKQTKSVLSGICGVATRHNALASNPCRDVSRISTKPQKAPRSLSTAEIHSLLGFLATDEIACKYDLHDLVMLMVATGLRIGEAIGVTWSAVNLVEGTVAVRGTLLRLKGAGLVLKPTPKSPSGERVLQLPSWGTAMLQARADRVPGGPEGSEPVFATTRGTFQDPSNARRAMRIAFAAAGMEGVTSHVFRKTVATLMDDAGLSARQAADQLGHAKPSMTADVYYGRRSRATGAARALESLDL